MRGAATVGAAWLRRTLMTGEQEGQGLVEYGLVLILVSVVAFVVLGTIGDTITELLASVAGTLSF